MVEMLGHESLVAANRQIPRPEKDGERKPQTEPRIPRLRGQEFLEI